MKVTQLVRDVGDQIVASCHRSHGGSHEGDSVGVHFLSRVNRAGFSALDHQEFLVIEGCGGGADAGS